MYKVLLFEQHPELRLALIRLLRTSLHSCELQVILNEVDLRYHLDLNDYDALVCDVQVLDQSDIYKKVLMRDPSCALILLQAYSSPIHSSLFGPLRPLAVLDKTTEIFKLKTLIQQQNQLQTQSSL